MKKRKEYETRVEWMHIAVKTRDDNGFFYWIRLSAYVFFKEHSEVRARRPLGLSIGDNMELGGSVLGIRAIWTTYASYYQIY